MTSIPFPSRQDNVKDIINNKYLYPKENFMMNITTTEKLSKLQLQALKLCDIELAFELWHKKDWESYKDLTDLLNDLIDTDRDALLDGRNILFLVFVFFYLVRDVPKALSEKEMFLWDVQGDLVRCGRKDQNETASIS
jgi:hypothetical protein